MYVIYLIIIVINLLSFFLILKYQKKKKERDNYLKETKYRKYSYLISSLFAINIFSIGLNTIYYIICLIFSAPISNFIIEWILFSLEVFIFLMLGLQKRKMQISLQYFEQNTYEYDYMKKLCDLSFYTLLTLGRVGELATYHPVFSYFEILPFVFVILSIIILAKYLYKNKNMICFSLQDEDYINDIRYYCKIPISAFYNYIIYIFAYILFAYIEFSFSIFVYLVFALLLIIIIIRKVKKIKAESTKLYQNIAILKNPPGITYAFDFYRDFLLCRRLLLGLLLFLISIFSLYIANKMCFSFISIHLYCLFIYQVLRDKKRLVHNIYALNSSFIDKNIYKIKEKQKITKILPINISFFQIQITFYQLIYIDIHNMVYKSDMILYDPELYIEKLYLYINPNNTEEYIFLLTDLYESV